MFRGSDTERPPLSLSVTWVFQGSWFTDTCRQGTWGSLPIPKLQPSQSLQPIFSLCVSCFSFFPFFMQLGSSSGGWNPVLLDVVPPVARATQLPSGSTPILQDGHGDFFLLSTFYLFFVELDVSDPGVCGLHHLLKEDSLTSSAPRSDPNIAAAFPQCTCTQASLVTYLCALSHQINQPGLGGPLPPVLK